MMTNKDDQQPDEEKSEANGDGLLFPELNDHGLSGTAEQNIKIEGHSDEFIKADKLISDEPSDIDEDIINFSDEELEQKFENSDEEVQETDRSDETSIDAMQSEPTVDKNTQNEPWGSTLAAAETPIGLGNDLNLDLDKEENEIGIEIENLPAIDTDSLDIETVAIEEPTQESLQELNPPKSIVGVIVTAIVTVAIILFIGFGSNEPPALDNIVVATEPAPFNTDESLVESEQVLVEEITLPEVTDEAVVIAEPSILEEESTLVSEHPKEVVGTTISGVENNASPASDNSTVQEEQLADTDTAIAANEVGENIAEDLTVVIDNEPPPSITLSVVESISEDAEETSIVLREATGNFYIIIASFSNEALALEHTNAMPESEESSVIIPPFGQSNRYRVAISGYETLTEAQANIEQYQSTYGAGIWPLRYTPSNLGTILGERTGNTYVIVSSFATEESARNHADSLASTEIEPLIIPPFNQSNRYRVATFSYETLAEAQEVLPQHRAIYGEAIWLLRY
jgi:hypothetical protein